jgi:hypothetical protein
MKSPFKFSRVLFAVALPTLIAACASVPDAAKAPRMPTEAEDWRCRFEGLFFEELAKQRDNNVSMMVAVDEPAKRFRALAKTPDEIKAVGDIIARGNLIAAFAYELKPLRPATMRHFGRNVCLMHAAGDTNPANPVKLAESTIACQDKFPPETSDRQLGECVAIRALQLLKLLKE